MTEMKTNNNLNGQKVTANVIMFLLRHDVVTASDLIRRFKLSEEAVENVIQTMNAAKILGGIDEYGVYPVIAKCLDDINEGIIEFLNDNGFTKQDIVDAFRDLDTHEKEEVSMILNEKRNWIDATTNMPDEDIPVIVRMVNKNIVYTENRSEVLYAEDIKIAEWNGEEWIIIPPYPKYDYSPISKFNLLNEGTVVTHWAETEDGELEDWQNRFNRFNDYKMKIEVDPEYEEDVYRALMWGAAYIAKCGGQEFENCKPGTGLRKMYETLCDMQACLDQREDGITLGSISKVVDYIIENGLATTTDGVYICNWVDLNGDIIHNIISEDEFNMFLFDIVKNIEARKEVVGININYLHRCFEIVFDTNCCPNYVPHESDECEVDPNAMV